MKKAAIIVLLALFASILFSQDLIVQPRVDERTELLSIIFRLAGAREYMNNNVPSYEKEIDDYFAPFKEHEAVRFAQNIRSERGVCYDAVMSLAINTEITDSIRLKPDLVASSIDSRWGDRVPEFIKLLNCFYFDTKFKAFFSEHRAVYKTAEDRFSEILKDVDFGWFEQFYGKRSEHNFNLILSIPNGGGNYGPKSIFKNGKEDLYAIIGCCMADSSGLPSYSNNVLDLIIHEFNHSFCNPLIDTYYPSMEKATIKIYKRVEDLMAFQAYQSPKTMDYEILVRACVIRYFQRNGLDETLLKRQVTTEMSNGFIWIDKLVDQLAVYEKKRDKYPALNDFMPEIVKLVNRLSPNRMIKEFEKEHPKIVSISIPNNSENVDPALTEITLTFDRPMSFRNGTSYGKQGREYFPEFNDSKRSRWNETSKKEWTFYIILEPDHTYSLCFPAQFFSDEKGYTLDKTYFLDFKTREE